MNSVSKSFRLPDILDHFLSDKAKEEGVSETSIVEKALENMMAEDNQWKKDLDILKNDNVYKEEQINMAEEYYEN